MSGLLRMAVRFVAIATTIAAIAMIFVPSPRTNSPYLSALSDLAVSPAYAAGCPDKACDHGTQCVSGVGFKCIRFNGKGCTATPCG